MEVCEHADPTASGKNPGDMRRADFHRVDGSIYDVAVIGAGVSGARIFHQLCKQGYRVLLLDRGDFASGTSQASGMMIWGGLLYLKDLDFRTVGKLCRARDEWVERVPEKVRAAGLLYLQGKTGARNRHLVHAGMWLYWLMGSLKRRFPRGGVAADGLDFLRSGRGGGFSFEEAVLKESDCRFALDWILPFANGASAALNHCEAEGMAFDRSEKQWRFSLRDRLHGHEAAAGARFIVNAAGVWTDELNGLLGVESPYRHELSKGVYVSIRKPESLNEILIFDTGKNGDTFTVSPWGPVALCGPTETRVTCLREGFRPEAGDVRSLLRLCGENMNGRFGPEDIVSLRCGVRPLAVRRGFSQVVHPLELSRRHLIHHDRSRQVIAVYGGKLTSCGLMAEEVEKRVSPHLERRTDVETGLIGDPPMEHFPGLGQAVPGARWCRDHERCLTLEDYLRRRTNIAQWVPRGGLGRHSENTDTIRRIARIFSPDEASAEVALASYQKSVRVRHDAVLGAV